MKILEIIATADPVSGGPIEGLVRQIASTPEIERDLATLDTVEKFQPPVNVRIFPLGQDFHDIGIFSFIAHYRYSRNFVHWLNNNARNYDFIVVNGLWNFSSFGSSMVLPNIGVPYFVFTHGMLDPWFRKTYPIKHFFKILFWLLGEGRLLAGAKAVLFTTEEELRLARNQFPLWRYNEEIVGYGTAAPPPPCEKQTLAFGKAVPTLQGQPYLLFLSRIHRKKGCDLLIEAFARVAESDPRMHLVVAGPDQEGLTRQLRQTALELGISDRVHWPGMLVGDAKWGAFRGADAFILPSHQENFGIVVAEALACSTPVLTTYKVNTWREIENNYAGYVEDDSLHGIESLMRRWIGSSPTQKFKMRENALRTFHSHFDVSTVGPSIISKMKKYL